MYSSIPTRHLKQIVNTHDDETTRYTNWLAYAYSQYALNWDGAQVQLLELDSLSIRLGIKSTLNRKKKKPH